MAICSNQRKYITDNKGDRKIFLETGFLRGDGVKSALDMGFEKVISIEIDEEKVRASKHRFDNEIKSGKVEIIVGDSAVKVKGVLENIDEPIFIYLDAHAHDFGKCPLEKELDIIKEHIDKNGYDHVVMVDDVWFIDNQDNFEGNRAWGKDIPFETFCEKLSTVFGDKVELDKIKYDSAAYSDGGKNYALGAKIK